MNRISGSACCLLFVPSPSSGLHPVTNPVGPCIDISTMDTKEEEKTRISHCHFSGRFSLGFGSQNVAFSCLLYCSPHSRIGGVYHSRHQESAIDVFY